LDIHNAPTATIDVYDPATQQWLLCHIIILQLVIIVVIIAIIVVISHDMMRNRIIGTTSVLPSARGYARPHQGGANVDNMCVFFGIGITSYHQHFLDLLTNSVGLATCRP
jgi:hypothetical protein